MNSDIRAIEFFCGIGGFAAAAQESVEIVAAVDINQHAARTYLHNFDHDCQTRSVESVTIDQMSEWDADLWWLSPPCQPFTRRGNGLDLDDPRSAGLRVLIQRLPILRPAYLALENVAGFVDSQAHQQLRSMLSSLGYQLRELDLCPSNFGIPNRRRRFFLVASRQDLCDPAPVHSIQQDLDTFLDPSPSSELWVDPEIAAQYPFALDVVDAGDSAAVTACFTAAYGHSMVRSGSYLRTDRGLRRFSPSEISRLLGFPDRFEIPNDLSLRQAWRLVGNSLSVPVVQTVLSSIPSIGDGRRAGRTSPELVTRPRLAHSER